MLWKAPSTGGISPIIINIVLITLYYYGDDDQILEERSTVSENYQLKLFEKVFEIAKKII